MNANELANLLLDFDVFHTSYKHLGITETESLFVKAATMIRQQQADKDRALRVLKEVDGILLDYIEQLEKKQEATTLAHGRGVALAVKYIIAVLEEAQEK